jgi:hypothetical protein
MKSISIISQGIFFQLKLMNFYNEEIINFFNLTSFQTIFYTFLVIIDILLLFFLNFIDIHYEDFLFYFLRKI